MTSATELDVFSRAKAGPQDTENRPKPVTGLTLATFWTAAKVFAMAAGKGFVLIRDKAWATSEFPHTPREWGAWMAYFRARRLHTMVFERQGKATVPAQWPHLFDATWRKEVDDLAADRYMAELARETRVAVGVIEGAARKNFIKGKLGYDPTKTRGISRLDDGAETPPQFIDKDALFADYDKDIADLKAKRAAKSG